MLLCTLTKDKLTRTWWINVAWQIPFNVCRFGRTTQQVWREASSYTVGRKEHTGPAAQDVNCHSLSLAAGEESSGGYSSWQISKGRQRLFVQLAEPPGEPKRCDRILFRCTNRRAIKGQQQDSNLLLAVKKQEPVHCGVSVTTIRWTREGWQCFFGMH